MKDSYWRNAFAVSFILNLLFILFHVMGAFMSYYIGEVRRLAEDNLYYGVHIDQLPEEVSRHVHEVPDESIKRYGDEIPQLAPEGGQLFRYENSPVVCYIGTERVGGRWVIRGTYWQGT